MQSPATATLSLGRCFLGAATMASGVLQLVTGEFVRLVPWWPAWLPVKAAWPYLVGVCLVVIGFAVLSGRRARTAATLLGAMILTMVLLLWPHPFIWNPVVDRPFFRGFMWTNPLKALALLGGAAILAGSSPGETRPLAALVHGFSRREALGPVFLALFLVVCGVQHFVYSRFVVMMVPSWIPPGQMFWTHFTGVALIAGGAGVLAPRVSRLAASLSGVMIFLWVLLLHIPRALAGPNHSNETAGVFEALALSGVAFLVAGTRAPDSGPQR